METEHKCENCGSGCGTDEDKEHGCGCNKNKVKTMTIIDNGVEVLCNVLDVYEIYNKKYIGLQNKDTDRIYLYGYSETNDDIVLNEIESVEELRLVGRAFIDLMEE